MSAPTIIITGASRGIGLATTRILLADGANVVAIQRSMPPELETLQKQYPNSFRTVQGDSTDAAVLQRAVHEAQTAFGALNGVVCNSAISGDVGPIGTLSLKTWARTFDVNLFGVVKLLREALPVLKPGARVVLVSSDASEYGVPAMSVYAASKAALNSLNRTLAAENPHLACVALHPGTVKTPGEQQLLAEAGDLFPPGMRALFEKGVIEAEVSGRVIASLALRATTEISGKYLHWNDPALSGL